MSGLVANLKATRATGFRVDVDIEIRPGTTVALLGPNGAGKIDDCRGAGRITGY